MCFLVQQLGVKRETLTPETSLFDDLGVDGDDFFEAGGCLCPPISTWTCPGIGWFFHHGEEGFNIDWILFKPPNRRVRRIRVTPKLLLESANAGKWALEYPAHNCRPYAGTVCSAWASSA